MQMTDDALVAHIEQLEAETNNADNSSVAAQQARALDYYLARPFGTEEDGRSQVISSDVWDVVEGMTPLILKPFVSSDDIVRFTPVGPEDEDAAEQESEYINYVVTQQNDVLETLVAWVKVGLLQKNAVVKYWWDTSKRKTIERYEGMTDDVFTQLLDDPNVTVVEHTETEGPEGLMHDAVIRVSQDIGRARYEVIPPEELRVSRNATSPNPKSARFVEHVTRKSISELREMGYDVDDNISDANVQDPRFSEQFTARRVNQGDQFSDPIGNDPAAREVIYREVYLYVDVDGDGMSELRRVCLVGNVVLANEETEEIPFVGWTPYPQPFQFNGRCPADEVAEVQLLKSTILRQTMDNIYTINNNTRYVSDKVNLSDMIDNQIAGIIRVQGDVVGNHVMAAPITPIGAITMPMVEYMDTVKENRTGFTRYNQGTDANSLNKTATGIRIIHEAGNERVGLISRIFADALRQLMLGIHGLCRRHSTRQERVRLRGEWASVDPRSWQTRFDMSVSVGLGAADKQVQMQGAQLLLQTQMNLIQAGIVKPENLYEAAAKLAQSIGEKSPEKYFTLPKGEPEKPDPTQDPAFKFQVAELHIKGEDLEMRKQEMLLKEREMALKEGEFKIKQDQLIIQVELARSKTHAEEADVARAQAEIALKAEQQGHDMTLAVMDAVSSIQSQLDEMQSGQASQTGADPRLDKLQAAIEALSASKVRRTQLTKTGDGQWMSEARDEI